MVQGTETSECRTLAFEIGTEELPAFDLHLATVKLEKLASDAFTGAGIPFGKVAVFSTPRRLIVMIEGIPAFTEAVDEEFRGPACKIAFDAEGNPTKAAAGFARGKGVDVSSLERREVEGVEYVFARVITPSRSVAELLPSLLAGLITSIPWPKSQRWGDCSEQFSRPVRWLLALFGSEVIPVSFAGLDAGSQTRGHRFLAPGPFEVAEADDLLSTLEGAFVIPSEGTREAMIREQVARAEKETGLVAELPEKVMAEVVNLTEYPTVMVGTFDEKFLAVPKEITVDAMLVHQRYFPLFNADGSLSNKFLVTSNGDVRYKDNIIDGNQRVVAARLYDAKFFFDEDLKRPLESYVNRLDEVVFQESLGTMRAKVARMCALSNHLAKDAGLSPEESADAARAALLAKADLVTGAVVEFTSVQGIMGSYYAEAAHESEVVCKAIADHYKPKFSGDELPEGNVGKIVAVADKLDTICGLFAVDQAPSGSSDPFALRRSAIGIIAMVDAGLSVSLISAIDASLDTLENGGLLFDRAAVRAQIIEFFVTRVSVKLRDEGCSADAVEAVLAVGVEEPISILSRVRVLENARRESAETFDDLATAYARANNLRDADAGVAYDEGMFADVEKQLGDAVALAEQQVTQALAADAYPKALDVLAGLRKPIDAFFEQVMVMDENESIRMNRMRLLNRFVAVFTDVADFGKMAKGSR